MNDNYLTTFYIYIWDIDVISMLGKTVPDVLRGTVFPNTNDLQIKQSSQRVSNSESYETQKDISKNRFISAPG